MTGTDRVLASAGETALYRRAALLSVAAALAGAGALVAVFWLPLMLSALAVAVLLGLGWVLFAARHPLPALVVVFFVFVLVYARLSLGVLSVAGPSTSNRGAIAVGDLLWLGMVAGAVLRWGVLRGRGVAAWLVGAAEEPVVWFMAPYVAAAVSLPLLGVLVFDWPLSYAVPGPRVLQHVGTGVVGYLVARERGAAVVLRGLFIALAAAGVLHVGYATIQLAYYEGILGPVWVGLDFLYSAQNNVGWFFYPRLTGLLVNPNAYGLLGAYMVIVATALALARAGAARPWSLALVASGAFALALSGSRSALLGLALAALVAAFLALRSDRLMTRLVRFALVIPVATLAAGALSWPLLPARLQDRYIRFLGVVTGGGAEADVNAVTRVEMWQDALRLYWNDLALGSWVPASFATNLPIDNYYVYSTVQGTPAYTLLWLVCFAAAIALGYQGYRRGASKLEAAAGLTLAGWTAVLLGSSMTLSPVLQPHLITPFWLLVGVVLASVLAAREGGAAPGSAT